MHLEIAAARLRSMEDLLLRPTPEAIRTAGALLQEAVALLTELSPGLNFTDSCTPKAVHDFRVLCDRVGKLLEGARRVQWIRLRLIASLTQTYSARAETKTWSPHTGNVNISM
jgi:hypothetical protein